MKDILRNMPKADLHLHLDGCVKPGTLLELAAAQGISLPADQIEELLPFMQVSASCDSLKSYLDKFDFVLPLLQTSAALERVAYEVVEQAASHNVIYTEVRFAPELHVRQGLNPDEVITAVLRGLARGEAHYKVTARLIVICMRHHAEEQNIPIIEAAIRHYGRGVVAVDLAGDEASFPADRFRNVFKIAREAGIPVTIHAGEAAGPFNVKEAVEGLGAVRIGHGVRLREDEALLEWILERGIPLELCPTSNIQTKAVAAWSDYPLRQYFDRGLVLTVNTDNPTVSGTDMTQELRELADRFGFHADELATLMRNALHAAFVEPQEKERLLALFEEKLLLAQG